MNPAPANEYERFLKALPETIREECRARLAGSGLSPDHMVFKVLADLYAAAQPPEPAGTAPDFLEEAQLHSQLSKQVLAEFQEVPGAILGRIDAQIAGLVDALSGPVATLTSTATDLQRNVEALPHLFGPKPKPSLLARFGAWAVGFGISVALSAAIAGAILSFGATSLSRHYEDGYQRRVARLESDAATDTAALEGLLGARITLKLERSPDGDGYFLVLRGARRAAQPINSPEGLVVQVWP